MLQKFKNFLTATNEQFQSMTDSLTTPTKPQSPKSAEAIIIDNFGVFIETLAQNENVPKKVIEHFSSLLALAKDIKFDDMTLDNQTFVRRILEVDTRLLLEVYLSLPKAHAVSVVLENGKTAKQTVIENAHNLVNKVNQICIDTVAQKTELLMKKQKVAQLKEKRKDFFDL